MVSHPNIGKATAEISHPEITLIKTHKADSPNYLFLDLGISEAATAGNLILCLTYTDGTQLVQTYELKETAETC